MSVHVMTIGRLYRNKYVSPVSSRNGRYATTLVIVAKTMALASLLGPIHAGNISRHALAQSPFDTVTGHDRQYYQAGRAR